MKAARPRGCLHTLPSTGILNLS